MIDTLSTALSLVRAGVSVIPIKLDGSKAPKLPWGDYQKQIATEAHVVQWFGEPSGIAAIGGRVSGGLECLDFDDDGEGVFDVWSEIIKDEAPRLIDALSICKTPSGGTHVRYRCDAVEGSQKLARYPAPRPPKGDTKIETKGERGYFIVEGSPTETHETGRLYLHHSGPALATVQRITAEQRELLIRSAKLFDESPAEEAKQEGQDVTGMPGDEFNRRGPEWAEILELHGWRLVRQAGNTCFWRRPGKDKGISATTGFCRSADGKELLAVFSSNAPPFNGSTGSSPCSCYAKFSAWGLLNFGKDFKKATREAAKLGYGTPQKKKRTRIDASSSEPVVIERADAVPEFPLDVFPSEVQRLCTEISQSMDCPTDFPAMAVLTVAATAIGGTVSIMPKPGWFEQARIFAAIVAEPGTAKSPAIAPIQAPICEAQREALKDYQGKVSDYHADMADWERKRAKYDAGQGQDPGRRPTEPTVRHLWTSDTTVEALGPILVGNPRGIGIFLDEASALFMGLNQYKAGGKGRDRQAYLSAWSGMEIKIDRKSGPPLIVPHPFLSIFGGIQPEMLSVMVEDRRREDGFVHRFLFSYPDTQSWGKWNKRGIDKRALELWTRLVRMMLDFKFAVGDGREVPHVKKLTAEAEAVQEEWWNRHTEERNKDSFPPILVGPWAKFRAYVFRLALVLHCLREVSGDTQSLEIDETSMEGATFLIEYFKRHTQKTYMTLHEGEFGHLVRRVQNWMERRAMKEASAKDLCRFGFCRKASEAIKLMEEIQDCGWGEVRAEAGANGKTRYVLKRFFVPL